MKQNLFEGLSKEQIEKVKECKNQEELLALAKNEGIELNEEQLAAVSGGCHTTTCEKRRVDEMMCPNCFNYHCLEKIGDEWYQCKMCGKVSIIKK